MSKDNEQIGINDLPCHILDIITKYAKQNNLINTPIGFTWTTDQIDVVVNAKVKEPIAEILEMKGKTDE